MFEMRLDRTHKESVGCLRMPGTTSASGVAAHCKEATRAFMERRLGSSSLAFPTPTSSLGATTKRKKPSSYLGPRSKFHIGALAVVRSRSLHIAGKTRPNLGVPADRDPRERGSRPLNTDR